jgi:hypothetical protein
VGLYASAWPNAYNGAQSQYAPYTAVNPGLGEFQITDNHSHSTYNALQLQLRRLSGDQPSLPERQIQFGLRFIF